MKNRDLIRLLEQFDPDQEVSIDIYECITDTYVDSTYDISFTSNEYDELILVINVEKGKFDHIKYT